MLIGHLVSSPTRKFHLFDKFESLFICINYIYLSRRLVYEELVFGLHGRPCIQLLHYMIIQSYAVNFLTQRSNVRILNKLLNQFKAFLCGVRGSCRNKIKPANKKNGSRRYLEFVQRHS